MRQASYNAIDVANYILRQTGPMTAMKLQKLVYYSQAWHSVWTEKPLFKENIEAWKNGPVVRKLYELHKGHFLLGKGFFNKKSTPPKALDEDAKDVVDRIIRFYGKRDPQWLSQLTHMEAPWKNARANCQVDDDGRSTEPISLESMIEYYSSL